MECIFDTWKHQLKEILYYLMFGYMDQFVPVNLPTYFYSDDLPLWSMKKELFKIIVICKEYR